MKNMIKIFENDEFGKVRTVIKDGEPWLVGKDVAEILGYSILSCGTQHGVVCYKKIYM